MSGPGKVDDEGKTSKVHVSQEDQPDKSNGAVATFRTLCHCLPFPLQGAQSHSKIELFHRFINWQRRGTFQKVYYKRILLLIIQCLVQLEVS